MERHKAPDQLSMDATAALMADMSYGKWMALHGNRPRPKPVRIEVEEPPKPKRIEVCKHCGKEFAKIHNRQKYCKPLCQQQANYHYVKVADRK